MLREFKDSEGVQWRVWDVNPLLHARAPDSPKGRFLSVPPSWLCFECDRDRKRLSPIPANWETIDDETLAKLCRLAQPVPTREKDSDAS